ncbi:type I toxin-antitoxin system antitoxin YafN [Sodalis ligni]|uniref:type I toxin-antitoxin system antitoxin YafN n=1 Tax=Sodalis ligni TaxID=2697027 RepID=UPI001FB7CA68|nr:type I toxin-antitoxin system antitoxin YafN [Sodalis ligni]
MNISELRKNPAKYTIDQPVAVLSNNRPAGYMVSAKLVEELMDLLYENQETGHIAARFRPTTARLNEITTRAQKLLQDASDNDLTKFTE